MTDLSPTSDDSTQPEDPQAAVRDRSKAGCVLATGKFLGHCLVIGSGFLFATGLLLRLTIRDAIPYVCVFYYATPTIMLSLAAFILCGTCCVYRKKRFAVTWFVMSILMFGWWHQTTYHSHPVLPPSSQPATSKKILFWNISYVDAGWPAILDELKKHDADIIGLVEVGAGYPHLLNRVRDAFPEHQLFWAGHGILLARGEWELLEWSSLNEDGNHAVVRARFPDGTEIDTVLVDIHGFVLMPRGPAMRYLDEVLSRQTSKPVCLMGDFNTPPDSVFFHPIRERFENAFETAGNGYYVTWPTIAPVLALDQIWLPPGTTISSKLHTTPHSDHRLVTALYQPAGKPVQKAAAPSRENPE